MGAGGRAWTDRDRLLAVALTIDEDARCTCGCGHYVDVAHDPESDGWLEVRADVTCYARAALDQWHKDVKDPEPGQLVRVVDARSEPDEHGDERPDSERDSDR